MTEADINGEAPNHLRTPPYYPQSNQQIVLEEVRRTAKEQHVTMSRALVALAERGVRAEAEAKENLKASYQRFLAEIDPARKNEAGKDMIRAIFGKDAIAEDSIR